MENVHASLLPKHKKVTTICGVQNGKILVCKNMFVRSSSLLKLQKVSKVSLPLDWANWMIEENRKDQSSEIQSSEIFSQKTKDEIFLLDSKIEKLIGLYLQNGLSVEEYQENKNRLMSDKQLLKEKLSAFEKKSHNRFELTDKFLKANISNIELANDRTNKENLHLFKKSVRTLKLRIEHSFLSHAERGKPFGFWIRWGNSNRRQLRADHIFGSETLSKIAEPEGFEPSRGFKAPASLAKMLLRPLIHGSFRLNYSSIFLVFFHFLL